MTKELSMDERFINQLDDIIEKHLEDEQFGVEELASELGLSRSQLHRKLNAIKGKSTSQYIREYRLQKAMELLQSNVATASEISYRVGFSSPTYFNSSFKEFYGYPPGEVKFRNQSSREDEKMIQSIYEERQNTIIKRKRFNKRSFLIAALAIILIAIFSYYNYSNSLKTSPTENIEPDIISKNSIAVMPFKNWSGNPDLDYVSDAMTDAVISRLTKIQSITKVIPFTSVINFKDSNKSIKEIAEELDVKNILQGNFQISGDEIKINLQLIDGLANNHFWTEEFTGKWSTNDIFKIQAEVAENVAKNINADITDIEYKEIELMPTKNIEAYHSFLKAEYIKGQLNKAAFKEAIPLYEKAIALDPNFTEAYIGFGRYWSVGGLFFGIFDEQMAWKNAKFMFERALELDPTNSSIAYELHMGYFYYDWNFLAVQKYFKENNFWDVDFYLKIGRYDEVLKDSENNLKKFPYDSYGYIIVSWAYFFLNDLEKSHEGLVFSRDMFHNFLYLSEASKLYYYLGDYKSAKELLDVLMNNFTDRPPLVNWLNAVLYNVNEDREKSLEYLNQLLEQYNDKVSGSSAWFIALYYSHIKDYDETVVWLQKSYDRHEVEMTWLKEEPLLRPLRTDPRYIEIYEKVGFSKIAPITPFID